MSQPESGHDFDLNKIRESKPKTIDHQAQQEAEAIFNESKRKEGLKNAFHKIMISIVWVGFSMFLVVFIIRVLHFILPLHYQWLSNEQVQGIDKLLFSGALGGFLGKYFNRLNS